MQPGPFQPLQRTLRELSRGTERVEELAGGVYRFCGFIHFAGAGEIITSIEFPVMFLEHPSFSFGGELEPNSPIQNGRLPTISGMVKDWKYSTREDTGNPQYLGATFMIVVSGLPDQLVVFHFQIEAKGQRVDVPYVVPEYHPLLGDLWVNAVVTDPPAPWTVGQGFGPVYVGANDLDPSTLVMTVDGGPPVPIDPSTSPVFYGNIVFLDYAAGLLGAPVHSGMDMVYFPDPYNGPQLGLGPHTVVVSCADVNGLTDTRTYVITAVPSAGGGF